MCVCELQLLSDELLKSVAVAQKSDPKESGYRADLFFFYFVGQELGRVIRNKLLPHTQLI